MCSNTLMLIVSFVAIALSACGGGGGSDGGSGNNGGGFTLSTQTATFTGKIQTSGPSSQVIQVHLTDSATASIAAGYRQGVVPASWLSAGLSGTGSNYTLVLSITPQGMAMALGTYTTTLSVATNNSSDDTLQARDIAVTFTLRDGLRITSGVNQFAFGTAGAPPATQSLQFTVASPAGIAWTAASSVPWMTPPSGTHTGPGTFDVTVNNTGLRADSNLGHQGSVTLTNTQDPTDTAVLQVSFVLQAPGIGISHVLPGSFGTATFGGDSGFESGTVALRITLGTGTNEFPWTATLTTTNGGNWLTADVTSGMVSEASSVIELNADRTQVSRGEYQGELRVSANVNGGFVQAVTPVVLRVEDNRIVVDANGVALSSFPSRSVLQRTLRVYDSWDSSTTAWQANADQSWLSVTPSGTAGDDLVLTADPAGLAAGQYTATVTITSNTARVVNQESVRVGFTVRGTNPVAVIDLDESAGLLAVNPVDPEIYVCGSIGNIITAYDIYSGVALRTFPMTNCGALLVSSDGRTLFMQRHDGNTVQADALDPVSGATQVTHNLNTTRLASMVYARPDARPLLISNGDTIDLVSGERVPQGLVTSSPFGVARNQRAIWTRDIFDFRSTYAHDLRYSAISSSPVQIRLRATNSGQAPTEERGSVSDLALSSSGDKVYVAAVPPVGQFDVLDPADMTLSGMLPGAGGPSNVETSWNGLLVAGASVVSGDDLWVYDLTGAERARLDSGTGSLRNDTVKFSGDGTRIVSGSNVGLRIQNAPVP